jgi:hypothetical protein
MVKIKASWSVQTKIEKHFHGAPTQGAGQNFKKTWVALFFGISLPKERFGLYSVSDGRNQGAGREKN